MVEKITVCRANVVFDISPEDKNYYMSQGFSVLDANGNVIERAMSNDVGELQIQVQELQKQLEACTSANTVLKTENDQLQAKLTALSAKKSSKKGE